MSLQGSKTASESTAPPRRKPSPAQLAANRRNALKSTGPLSAEGKRASCMNALTHGLTAREVVLPSENVEAFEERKEEWLDHYCFNHPAQRLLVERGVHASWRLDRCERAERAMFNERARHAVAEAERFALDNAESLGRRLLFEPVDRGSAFDPYQPQIRARLDRREQDHPANLARALKSTAQGVDWLLERWSELRRSLDILGEWTPVEKFKAIRLLGRRPEDCTDDPAVAEIFLACHAMKPSSYDLWDDFNQARIGVPGRITDSSRIEALRQTIPNSPDAGRAVLRAIIEYEVARLEALKSDTLDELADDDLRDAADRAAFDASHAAFLLHLYKTACERELRRTVSALFKGRFRSPWPEAPAPGPTLRQIEPIAPVSLPDPEPAPTPQVKLARPESPSPRQPPEERKLFRSPPPLHQRIRLSGRRSL